MNEDVYQYYVEFINLLFNDGGVFSPPPVNPDSNIKNITNPENKPLGFIQFSSLQRKRLVIEKEINFMLIDFYSNVTKILISPKSF